ncbi:MAG: hypothetical protein D6698_06780 [Gammaproteobacteria bacterium]|nr:MAG: hypothetical protein D6698_06780 [Gammaproteobacteria bacterium]
MATRIPRGYDAVRPPYLELCEGERPNVHAVPLEAWTGLPAVRVDEYHHDPIVIDAGTVVGVITGNAPANAAGKLFPAVAVSGSITAVMKHHSDGASWGLPTSDVSISSLTSVKPIGVVYQPIYSFMLQETFTNYKRNDNVGVVTDYVIQIPAITTDEHAIRAGDMVAVAHASDGETWNYGSGLSIAQKQSKLLGRYRKFDTSLNVTNGEQAEFVIGRCLSSIVFATGAADSELRSDSTAALTADGQKEFQDLNRVQTVPGLKLSGSGTAGVPAHLLSAVSDGSNNYRALTILVRL